MKNQICQDVALHAETCEDDGVPQQTTPTMPIIKHLVHMLQLENQTDMQIHHSGTNLCFTVKKIATENCL